MTKIMVFGTFDALHPGHVNFFEQARRLAKEPFLIVSIARDMNVKKIKKKAPTFNEMQRLRLIASSKLVDKALLGSKTDYLSHILKEKPEIIALGYDQVAYTKNLGLELNKLGLQAKVIRLKAFRPNLFKTSKLRKKYA